MEFSQEEISNGIKTFDKISEVVCAALQDNTLELHEIPAIVNIIHETLKELVFNGSIKISQKNIGNAIKTVLLIMIDTRAVKIKPDLELVISLIDSCLILLNKSVEIKIPKRCFCFSKF